MHSLNEVKIRTRTIQCNENASANVRRDQTRPDILQGQVLKKKEKKTDGQIEKTDGQKEKKTDRQKGKKTDRQKEKKSYKKEKRQMDK